MKRAAFYCGGKAAVTKQKDLKSFARYASLSILGMLGMSCYILADTFFISQALGPQGLTALNLAIPIYSFVHGTGLMLGMGGSIKYAIAAGRGDRAAANRVFTRVLVLAGLFAAAFFTSGLFFSGPLSRLLGADEAVFGMTDIYLKVILLFSPAFMLNNVLICFVRNDGAPRLSMMAMLGGSLSNILLDYMFMFPLGMGMFGAVLATGLAPVISLSILSPFLIKGKNSFQPIRASLSIRPVIGILSSGLPSLITELSAGIVMIAFNAIILRLRGNTGVAAYSIIANLSLVVMSMFTGIAQGVQPLLSRCHGRGETARVRNLLRLSLLAMAALSILIYTAALLLAGPIASVFNSQADTRLQSIAMRGLRLYFSACLFAGFNIILSVYFTSIERPRPAHIISLLRGFGLILPLAFLMAALFDMDGVWLAFPVTEAAVSLVSAGLLRRENPKNETSVRQLSQ